MVTGIGNVYFPLIQIGNDLMTLVHGKKFFTAFR